jgi:hypothetical protein
MNHPHSYFQLLPYHQKLIRLELSLYKIPKLCNSLPTYKFLAIPTPPDNIKEPVDVDVASVAEDRNNPLKKVAVSPTYNFLTIDKPPDTSNEPVDVLDASTDENIDATPPMLTFLATPNPPRVVNAPDVDDDESVVSTFFCLT